MCVWEGGDVIHLWFLPFKQKDFLVTIMTKGGCSGWQAHCYEVYLLEMFILSNVLDQEQV